MTSDRKMKFDAEKELNNLVGNDEAKEDEIIHLFLLLPKDRQRAILSELWNEFKPETPKGLRNFQNIPY